MDEQSGKSAEGEHVRKYVIEELATGRYPEGDFVCRKNMPHIQACTEVCGPIYDAAVAQKNGGKSGH